MKEKTLRDSMPACFSGMQYTSEGEIDTVEGFSEYAHTKAYKMRHLKVVREYDGTVTGWPGTHKNVYFWVELDNGWAVGWNESPSRGWGFPAVKMKK